MKKNSNAAAKCDGWGHPGGNKQQAIRFELVRALLFVGDKRINVMGRNMKRTLLLAIAFIACAASADTTIPTVPQPPKFGKLLIKGQLSVNPDAPNEYDKYSAGQNVYFEACRFLVKNGVPVKFSSEECVSGVLNKSLRLLRGNYLLNYMNTRMVTTVDADQTRFIELAKIQSPRVDKATRVVLDVDYTDLDEQNREFFNQRINSANRDWTASLDRFRWSRENLAEFFNTGDLSKITKKAREAHFTPKGELCVVDFNGSLGYYEQCEAKQAGDWERFYTTSKCTGGGGGIFDAPRQCETQKFRRSWDSAFFLVFPGTYTMTWHVEGEEQPLVKSGIKAK